jgi:hypothetical protein
VVPGVFAVFCPRAFALNPFLEINQYAHTTGTVRGGFFNGAIDAIGQDRAGYLLLATEFGLLRFEIVAAPAGKEPKAIGIGICDESEAGILR